MVEIIEQPRSFAAFSFGQQTKFVFLLPFYTKLIFIAKQPLFSRENSNFFIPRFAFQLLLNNELNEDGLKGERFPAYKN